MSNKRIVVWFSCGAASAVAAYLAKQKYGAIDIVYCDTSKDEHPDNMRFLHDVEKWIGQTVTIIASATYTSVTEVFAHRRYMSGMAGAPCTVAMKKIPRFEYQRADDLNIFGMDSNESKRITSFEINNPELHLEWILRDQGITKSDCFQILQSAGIKLPVLYGLGFKNNNCIGCVKATSPKYWNMVREHFPETFKSRAEQSRVIGCRLTRIKSGKKWERIFLDELPVGEYKQYRLENISCGPECGGNTGV
jgi:hypothetical protein